MRSWPYLTLALAIFGILVGSPKAADAREPEFQVQDAGRGVVSIRSGIFATGFWIGPAGVVVFDPTSPAFAARMMVEIRKRTKLPIAYVIYSHNHWDHISGAKVFVDEGAIVVAHKEAADSIKPNPDVAQPTLVWTGDSALLRAAGGDLILHYVGPSHGKGMTVSEIPMARAVFVTDLIVARRVGFMDLPDFDPEGWLQSLKAIEKIDFDVLLLAHDFGGKPLARRDALEEQKQFLVDLNAAVDDSLTAGATLDTLGEAVKLRMQRYKDWARFDSWMPLNAMRIALGRFMGW